VLVVEVEVVDAEALEAGVAGGADVLRGAVDAHPRAVGVALVAECSRGRGRRPRGRGRRCRGCGCRCCSQWSWLPL